MPRLLKNLPVLASAMMLALCISNAHASLTADITYYKIDSSDADANQLCCSGPLPEVENTLGPNGLPVLLSNYAGVTPHDVNAAGELTYWSPAFNSHVSYQGTQVVSLPFNNSNMYNPLGTGTSDGGSNGYLAAVISADLIAPTAEQISFTISSDDNAFVFLDGQIVCNDGGVHGAGSVNCTSATVSAGTHTLLVFYDDLNQTGAELDFSINTQGITTTPNQNVPEPASLALLGVGLATSSLVRRRKA